MFARPCLSLLLALTLTGCVSFPRPPAPPGWPAPAAEPPGFGEIRERGRDPHVVDMLEREIVRARAASTGTVSILALSGGGAEGAFGAGVLVGWTRSGQRPEFQVVTGVSTGALIAPFAFLGKDWDDRLRDAFAGDRASGLLVSTGAGILFGPSAFRGRPLEKLVESYVTDDLLAAVAREHARGRRLLVATTDLDHEEAVIWNMGAIAATGGPKARRLFRQVLVASASIPGVFPPKLISVEGQGKTYAEMHVDGGVATPFFSAPPSALFWTAPNGLLERAHLYVIVNGRLTPLGQTTAVNTFALLGRSVDTMETSAWRSALGETVAFCRRNGVALDTAAMPRSVKSDGPFEFRRRSREHLFQQGEQLGESGAVWTAWKAEVPAIP